MSLTASEKRAHALRISNDVLENAEFSWVFEDEGLEDASEQDQADIHNLILGATAVIA